MMRLTGVDVARRQSSEGVGVGFPWSMSGIGYEGYMWSIAAEVGAAQHVPDAMDRIIQARSVCTQHRWAWPALLRAEARLTGDDGLLREAAEGFAAIDAVFEHATTLAMLPGGEGDSGRATLRGLGCRPDAAAEVS